MEFDGRTLLKIFFFRALRRLFVVSGLKLIGFQGLEWSFKGSDSDGTSFGLDWFFQTGLLVRIFKGLDGGFSGIWLNGFMVLDQTVRIFRIWITDLHIIVRAGEADVTGFSVFLSITCFPCIAPGGGPGRTYG
jgi:hypothetical protein